MESGGAAKPRFTLKLVRPAAAAASATAEEGGDAPLPSRSDVFGSDAEDAEQAAAPRITLRMNVSAEAAAAAASAAAPAAEEEEEAVAEEEEADSPPEPSRARRAKRKADDDDGAWRSSTSSRARTAAARAPRAAGGGGRVKAALPKAKALALHPSSPPLFAVGEEVEVYGTDEFASGK